MLNISLFILHSPHSMAASSTGNFAWAMFLPAIIAQQFTCSAAHPERCTDSSSCTAVGGYWYNNRCNATEQPEDPNRTRTEKLAGSWTFKTTINSSTTWTDNYELDINSVKEDPVYPGEYIITGINSDTQSKVTAGYVPEDNYYFLYDLYNSSIDLLFLFTFTDPDSVSGENYILENNSTDIRNGPYPTSGEKTNL